METLFVYSLSVNRESLFMQPVVYIRCLMCFPYLFHSGRASDGWSDILPTNEFVGYGHLVHHGTNLNPGCFKNHRGAMECQ